jgi:SAM-dependent methyltransferase
MAGPRVNQALWRVTYRYLASRIPMPEWAFMNYGYAALGPETDRLDLEPRDEPDRYCIQLYDRVASRIDLTGCELLEVGSGRGGGSSYVKRYLRPAFVVGADLSLEAVRLCNRHRAFPGLVYVQGDAQALQFPDASFDAVLNVESSHCYPSMETFVSEVHRVLRPGGHFLFADFRPAKALPALHAQLAGAGLEVVEKEVITPNVVAALELDSDRKLALIGDMVPGWLQRPFARFAGIQGSRTHEDFRAGRTEYVRYVLRKP